MQQNITQLNVRVPQEIKDFLQEEAKKDERSLNSHIVKIFKTLKEQSKEAKAWNQQAQKNLAFRQE